MNEDEDMGADSGCLDVFSELTEPSTLNALNPKPTTLTLGPKRSTQNLHQSCQMMRRVALQRASPPDVGSRNTGG